MSTDVLWLCRKELLRRRYSDRTVKTYLYYINRFLQQCHNNPRVFSKKDIREFLEDFSDKGRAGNSINVVLNALKFMMEEVLRKNMRLDIRYSKVPKTLPTYLTKDEVRDLLNAIINDQQRLMISLMYGAGLRVSELVMLKKEDLDLSEGIGWVRHGKGNKDRPFIIPISLQEDLAKLTGETAYYLFPGNKGYHYSVRSVQQIVTYATRIAKIKKRISPHTLRHSFATHLIEDGYDIFQVQSLLGHNEVRTTLEYLHMVNPKMSGVKSPLDTCLAAKGE